MTPHHIGYLVKNTEKAGREFTLLGFEQTLERIYDVYRDVNICFYKNNSLCVELVSPVSDSSVVAGLMKMHKIGPYHICFVSDDLDSDIERLTSSGFAQIDEPTPAPALEGRKVCSLMSARLGMIELMEKAVSESGICPITDGTPYHQYVFLHPVLLTALGRRREEME